MPELAKECERLLPLSKFADVLKKLAAETLTLIRLKAGKIAYEAASGLRAGIDPVQPIAVQLR